MGSKLINFRNYIIAGLSIEILILIVLYFALNNVLILMLAIYAILKNVMVFILIARAADILKESDSEIEDALSTDSKNALIFGGVGLVKFDENRYIIWTSELFKELNIKLEGVKLLEWQPQLATLFEDDDIKLVDIKGKKYEAYLSKETRMIFFKDVSEFVSLQQDYDDQQVCFGYITIDNYEETISNLDEQTSTKIRTKSREIIFNWAEENGMIIRRYKTGGYLAFFNERTYQKLVTSQFQILEKYREMTEEYEQVLTLSIGIGRESRILKELDELAASALNLTYSRGGNQVCVKSSDGTVKYYGAKTDSNEKTSKIKSRVIIQSLCGAIKRASKVYIVGHKTTDLDSFGASIGLARLVQACGVNAHIVIDNESIEEKTKKASELFSKKPENKGIIIHPNEAIEQANKNTLIILVDHNNPQLLLSPGLVERVKNRVVIDHHRRTDQFIEAPMLSYLESSASSTVELVVELTNYANVDTQFTSDDATIMYAGLLMDTNNFKRRVGVRTFNAAAKLKEYNANILAAEELLEDDYEENQRKLEIISHAYWYNDYIMIAASEEVYQRSTIAKASNQLLETGGVKAAFTIAKDPSNMIAISARSKKDINVQVIMESMGGGGHFSMSAVQLKDISLEEARIYLEEKINEYLENRSE